ncbi:MAG: hypothetical protein GY906_26015 [bacterium]|nr:hypothetical protein [bacterium]
MATEPMVILATSDYKDYEVLQYYRQTQQTKGREFFVLTPTLAPDMRLHVDKLIEQLQPPPLVRSQAERANGPQDVREYLLGDDELPIFEERLVVPPGLPVLVSGEAQRQLLQSVDLVTEPVGNDLWRVTLEPPERMPLGGR